MKITIEYQGEENETKASIEISDDSDIHEVVESLSGLLVAYGFHPNSVRDGFLGKAEDYEIQDKTTEQTDT
jgi:hypothetical protein